MNKKLIKIRFISGTKDVTPRWEMCVDTLQKFVGYGMEAMLEMRISDAETKRKVVSCITFRVLLSIIDSCVIINCYIREYANYSMFSLRALTCVRYGVREVSL